MKKNYTIPQARLILLMEEAELMQNASIPLTEENVDDSSTTRRQSFDNPWSGTTLWDE